MNRAAIYARVSTQEQSCDLQVERLTNWAKTQEFEALDVYRDDGISGILDNRPQLDLLRSRLSEYGTVIVAKIDRLGRSTGMILRFWDEADAANVRIVVVDQAIDTSTASGRLQRTMLAALAEFERELILERTRGGIARARALGKKFGRPREISGPIAEEVVHRRAAGESLRQISQRMGLRLGAVRWILQRERAESPPRQTATVPTPETPPPA